MDCDEITDCVAETYPGRHSLIKQLLTLATTSPPPCIHIHAPFSPRPTASLVRSALDAIQARYASINGVECFNARILYDRILNGLAGHDLDWTAGCETFGEGRYNKDLDHFLEGLRVISRRRAAEQNLFVVLERAERFKENLPDYMLSLTRLAELSRAPITVIFISTASWFELRPLSGTAIDPYIMNAFNTSKEDAVSRLSALFSSRNFPGIHPYMPILRPLYSQYASAVYSVCSPYFVDDYELAYVTAACWPAFVAPLLSDWRAQLPERDEDAMDEGIPALSLPIEESRMRLVGYFTPTFTRALEALYPRKQHASEWATLNEPSPQLRLSELPIRSEQVAEEKNDELPPQLTTIGKYVLVAAFLASSNPAKTDIRLIGRAPEDRKRKRGGGARKIAAGTSAKIPQRLLGPAAFPIDRLIAILGSLMEEHGENVAPPLQSQHIDDEDEQDPEKDTEMVVWGVRISATIAELVNMRLLHRTTPTEKLDGPPSFKCGITQARAFKIARDVGITTLADLMWDPNP
ncbi:hypothetical protein M422DRAFT_246764 [Sphaerobolus stellatus SS14]|nr:hypothetical protein M422DRAFT_246764 [Sphaerobolus stellatus SS14]